MRNKQKVATNYKGNICYKSPVLVFALIKLYFKDSFCLMILHNHSMQNFDFKECFLKSYIFKIAINIYNRIKITELYGIKYDRITKTTAVTLQNVIKIHQAYLFGGEKKSENSQLMFHLGVSVDCSRSLEGVIGC